MPLYEVVVNNKSHRIELLKTGKSSYNVKIDGKPCRLEAGGKLVGGTASFTLDGREYEVEIARLNTGKPFPVKVNKVTFKVKLGSPRRSVQPYVAGAEVAAVKTVRKQVEEGVVTSPMAGKIVALKVEEGDTVKTGQILCILEAMKMENEIVAPHPGIVDEIYISEGVVVNEGDSLLTLRTGS